uniref:C2 domain-containing protein n=1 Tax=Spongospora subterranea TaxID=70186 RepID=A0A0H5RR87_9EUKA|eukprot:CRZ11234.1 hypothetical protein [Spongospora subterranea]
MEVHDDNEDLDVSGNLELTAEELAECGLTLDDIRDFHDDNGKHETVDSDHNADLLSQLRDIYSGSDIDDDLEPDQNQFHGGSPIGEALTDDNDLLMVQDDTERVMTFVHTEEQSPEVGSIVSDNQKNDVEAVVAEDAAPRLTIQQEINQLKIKAVELNRANKKAEALNLMRKIKRLQATFTQDSGPVSLPINGSEAIPKLNNINAGDVVNESSAIESGYESKNSVKETILHRLSEYTAEALSKKREGDIPAAKLLMQQIHNLRAAKDDLENNRRIPSLDSLPAPLNLSSLDQLGGVSKQESQLQALKDLESALHDQVARVHEESKAVLKLGLKDEARSIIAVKAHTERALQRLVSLRTSGDPLPKVIKVLRDVSYLRSFDHIGSNQLELEIKQAECLTPPSGWSLCTSFVSYELIYPKDVVQKGVTQTVENNDDPVFGLKKLLSFPRPKHASRMLNFVKISFSVQVPRRLLFKPIIIGTADLRLGPLLSQSELTAVLPLRGGSRGKLQITLRLRTPLEGQDVATKTVEDIFIEGDLIPRANSPSPRSIIRSSTNSGTPHSAVVSPTPMPCPSGIDREDWNDPHRLQSICSNDVIDTLIQNVTSEIGTCRAKKMDPPPTLLIRVQQLISMKQKLEQSVEDGSLTLSAYLDMLRKDIMRLSLLASALQRANRSSEADIVRNRLQIQQSELDTAMSNS